MNGWTPARKHGPGAEGEPWIEKRQRRLGGFGTDSSQTPRWRNRDSNRGSRVPLGSRRVRLGAARRRIEKHWLFRRRALAQQGSSDPVRAYIGLKSWASLAA